MEFKDLEKYHKTVEKKKVREKISEFTKTISFRLGPIEIIPISVSK